MAKCLCTCGTCFELTLSDEEYLFLATLADSAKLSIGTCIEKVVHNEVERIRFCGPSDDEGIILQFLAIPNMPAVLVTIPHEGLFAQWSTDDRHWFCDTLNLAIHGVMGAIETEVHIREK